MLNNHIPIIQHFWLYSIDVNFLSLKYINLFNSQSRKMDIVPVIGHVILDDVTNTTLAINPNEV